MTKPLKIETIQHKAQTRFKPLLSYVDLMALINLIQQAYESGQENARTCKPPLPLHSQWQRQA